MNRGRRCARRLAPDPAVPVVHFFDFLHQVVAVCSLRKSPLTNPGSWPRRTGNSVRSVMRALRVLIAVASVRGRGRVRARSRWRAMTMPMRLVSQVVVMLSS